MSLPGLDFSDIVFSVSMFWPPLRGLFCGLLAPGFNLQKWQESCRVLSQNPAPIYMVLAVMPMGSVVSGRVRKFLLRFDWLFLVKRKERR